MDDAPMYIHTRTTANFAQPTAKPMRCNYNTTAEWNVIDCIAATMLTTMAPPPPPPHMAGRQTHFQIRDNLLYTQHVAGTHTLSQNG